MSKMPADQANSPEQLAKQFGLGWKCQTANEQERAKGQRCALSYANSSGFVVLNKTTTAFTITVMEYGVIYPDSILHRVLWTGREGLSLTLSMQPLANRMLIAGLNDTTDPRRLFFRIFAGGSLLKAICEELKHGWEIAIPSPPDDLQGSFAMS